MAKYQIGIIYDVPGWAYERRADALKKYAPPEFDVMTVALRGLRVRDFVRSNDFDLLFLLDYAAASVLLDITKGRRLPLVVSYNSGPARRRGWLRELCKQVDYVICNNVEQFEARPPGCNNCCAISNGVDTEIFYRMGSPTREWYRSRCLWYGLEAKSWKGWEEVIRPLQRLARDIDFQCDFRLVKTRNDMLDSGSMTSWYNSGAYILSASADGHEATPNSILEGMACGCVAVSTPSGNISEFGIDRENCVLVHNRTPEAFMDAIRYARHHQTRLSEAGQGMIREQWAYRVRAEYFFGAFKAVIDAWPERAGPWQYDVMPATGGFERIAERIYILKAGK